MSIILFFTNQKHLVALSSIRKYVKMLCPSETLALNKKAENKH